MTKIYVLAQLAIFTLGFSFAQENEFSGAILYEMPQGDLGTIYSPAPLYQISYQRLSNYKKKLNSFGVNLGYMSMSSQKSSFNYLVELDGVTSIGKATYSTYNSYQLFFNYQTGRILNKVIEVFGGVDLGFNFTTYQYSLNSVINSEEGSINITRYVLAPKSGIGIILSKSWRLNAQVRYLVSIGNNDKESSLLNHYISIGTGLSYRF
jgi:hypothetical protein